MRGEATISVFLNAKPGITPACAGRSGYADLLDRVAGDHPRVCGEKCSAEIVPVSFIGSPPRVRGEAAHPHETPARRRITPACAGRSDRCKISHFNLPDHPRVCGEKHARKQRLRAEVGSPPRVRGEDICQLLVEAGIRITPACAGRSIALRRACVKTLDHPRVCGEKVA